MVACRDLALLAIVVGILAATPNPVVAQFAGRPSGSLSGGPPTAPSATCRQLLALHDETQKNANTIKNTNVIYYARQNWASADQACKLFRTFVESQAKMIKELEDNPLQCDVLPERRRYLKAEHAKDRQFTKRICDAAARSPLLDGKILDGTIDDLGRPKHPQIGDFPAWDRRR